MSSSLAPHAGAAPAHSPPLPGPVLAATAGTGGRAVLRVAREAADRLHAGLRVVSVLEVDSVYLIGLDSGPLLTMYESERRMERKDLVRREYEEALGADPRGAGVPIEVRAGAVAQGVQAAALEHGASLVVAGSGHRDLGRRLLMGESALRIARRAPCTVLLVPEDAHLPVRTAVVGVDFSASSVAAARDALRLLAPGGTLHLVHAWPRLGDHDRWLREQDERYADALPGRLARIVEVLGVPAGVRVETAALVGETAEAVLAHAARVGAELVAVGRHGHGLLERLLVGSVTTRLVRAAPCAVLVTPEPSAADAVQLERGLEDVVRSEEPEAWTVLLGDLVRRNEGRAVLLEEAGPVLGAHVEAMGYRLLGATYDVRDQRALLMLGEPSGMARLLTHSVPDVRSMSVVRAPDGRDVALRVQHGDGWTLLTFLAG